MTAKERHFFAAGNTARGYVTFFDSVLEGMERIFLLSGGVEGMASPLIEQIGRELGKKAGEVEWIHSPFQAGEYDGVVFPRWKAAVMDYSYPRRFRPKAPGLTEISVNLQTALHADRLAPLKEKIAFWHEEFFRRNQQAYECFAEALRIHDEWEAIYIQNLDHEKANRVAEEMCARLYEGGKLAKKTRIRRMFLGASTPKGPVDYLPNLTEGLEKRYFIKGRAGSGKSTLLKRLLREAEERGFDAEVYHCGLDPNSLDMIILPEKSVAIFDSTAPHEYFPEKESDEVIDMYALAISPGTDEAHAAEIGVIEGRYRQAIKAAIAHLKEAEEYHLQINQAYAENADSQRLQAIVEEIAGALPGKCAG